MSFLQSKLCPPAQVVVAPGPLACLPHTMEMGSDAWAHRDHLASGNQSSGDVLALVFVVGATRPRHTRTTWLLRPNARKSLGSACCSVPYGCSSSFCCAVSTHQNDGAAWKTDGGNHLPVGKKCRITALWLWVVAKPITFPFCIQHNVGLMHSELHHFSSSIVSHRAGVHRYGQGRYWQDTDTHTRGVYLWQSQPGGLVSLSDPIPLPLFPRLWSSVLGMSKEISAQSCFICPVFCGVVVIPCLPQVRWERGHSSASRPTKKLTSA